MAAGVAAYGILTENKQLYTGPIGSQYLHNAGDTESYGVELDARIFATDNLTFDVGAALGRATFTNASNPDTGETFDGNDLPYAPNLTLNGAVDYLVPQTVVPGDLTLRLAGTYSSQTYFDEANTLSQDGYALFDTSLDLKLDNGAEVRLFVNNITDEIYRTYSYQSGGNTFSSVGRGRVFGVAGRIVF